jgi:hypothetical protein
MLDRLTFNGENRLSGFSQPGLRESVRSIAGHKPNGWQSIIGRAFEVFKNKRRVTALPF